MDEALESNRGDWEHFGDGCRLGPIERFARPKFTPARGGCAGSGVSACINAVFGLLSRITGVSGDARFTGLTWAAKHLLLLTATPHMGKESPWHHLWRLLDHHAFGAAEALRRFPPEARQRHFIQRTKEEMVDLAGNPLYRQRECRTFSFDLTEGEDGEEALDLHTTAYLREHHNRAHRNRSAAQLAMSVFQRRLASSASALLPSFRRRIEKLGRDVADWQSGRPDAESLAHRERLPVQRQRDDFFDTHGADEDVREDGATPGGRTPPSPSKSCGGKSRFFKACVPALLHSSMQATSPSSRSSVRCSKIPCTRRTSGLSSPSTATPWISWCGASKDSATPIRSPSSTAAWPEREEQVERFRAPDGARFLIATDAAGEGINLRFCHLMVNYDIP